MTKNERRQVKKDNARKMRVSGRSFTKAYKDAVSKRASRAAR